MLIRTVYIISYFEYGNIGIQNPKKNQPVTDNINWFKDFVWK